MASLHKTFPSSRHFYSATACIALAIGGCASSDESSSNQDQRVVGEVEVLSASYEDRDDTLYFLIDHDGQRTQLVFDVDPKLESGDHVEVFGTKTSDGKLLVESVESIFMQARSLEVPGQLRPPLVHKVAVLLLSGTDVTRDQAAATIVSVDALFRENSAGIDSFTGEVFGPYAVDATDCANRYHGIRDDAVAAFAAEGNNPNDYNHIAVVLPKGANCGWGGLGVVGTPGRPQRGTWYANWFDCRNAAHELGHNAGFRHSGSLACAGNIYNASGAGCSLNPYGHVFDNMGGGSCDVHYSAPQKQYQGWLERCEDVTAGGGATFNVGPLEGGCGIRSLRIPIPGESSFYYVEYRKQSAGLYAGAGGADRVLLSVSNDGMTTRPEMRLLDSTPSTGTFTDAWLAVGQTYSLPGGVSIKVLAQGETAQVQVVMTKVGEHACAGGENPPVLTDGSVGDGCGDECPADPDKVIPGTCGCGVRDVDSDKDGALDCLDKCPNDANKTDPGQCGCGVPEGACSGSGTIYEAENCTDKSGAILASQHAGFTGNGFMDYGGMGTWISWNHVQISQQADYLLTFRYANGGSPRPCSLIVNGKNLGNLAFANTGGWANWRTNEMTVPLSVGVNTIQVVANTASGGPNLDNMEVRVVVNTADVPRCTTSAEGSPAALACPSGTTIAAVTFASYGMPVGSCDTQFATGSCHAPSSKPKVETLCLNKQDCTVSASNVVFGDPCVGTRKKLAVVYTCK